MLEKVSATPEQYLDGLKRRLSGLEAMDDSYLPQGGTVPFEVERRVQGRDWPTSAETMIGLARLDNLESCIRQVIVDHVPGDLIETGVWRGGACIFMRAVLRAVADAERLVWVADSFEGLPRPDSEQFPADAGDELWTFPQLAVGLDEVKRNFEKYGLLDDRVRFLPGWFRDTLPTAPIQRLALLRLDGDLYESTIIALTALYPRLSPGGFVIIDDYALATSRAAVDDYRRELGINAPIHIVDWSGVFWRKGF